MILIFSAGGHKRKDQKQTKWYLTTKMHNTSNSTLSTNETQKKHVKTGLETVIIYIIFGEVFMTEYLYLAEGYVNVITIFLYLF